LDKTAGITYRICPSWWFLNSSINWELDLATILQMKVGSFLSTTSNRVD
jgi:hypothetical protein